MNIAIITGWNNSEREISLISASAVLEWLGKLWYSDVVQYDFPKELEHFIDIHTTTKIDFVFLIIHGKWWEDGQVASFLDLLHIPYQCTSPSILAITMNKRHTKLVRRAHDLPVAKDILIIPTNTSYEKLLSQIENSIQFPCVRKELDQGSSKGVHILHNAHELQEIYIEYARYAQPILIEQFIQGEEITIPILDAWDWSTNILPLIHIIPPLEWWFDYENKYNGKTQELCPANFDKKTVEQVNAIALQAYHAVWCTSYGRIDAILTEHWPILLEINTIPWFTAQSLFPKSAEVFWLSFPQLLQHLIAINIKNDNL